MSSFAVKVSPITIQPHDNADALEIGQVYGYQTIVRKGAYQTGDLVAYIPEQSVVPDAILEEMGLTGRLAGPQKNRVKAVRLRGVLSQGLCYPAREGWVVGQDVTEELGVTKWEPPIPTEMAGQVWHAGTRRTVRYDIENFRRYPDVLREGEQVVMTEKIHGTFCGIGLMPDVLTDPEHGGVVVFSKGIGAKGQAFKFNGANENNLYLRAYRAIADRLSAARDLDVVDPSLPFFILGEVFGAGVQDLSYGHNAHKGDVGFRVFDAYRGQYGHGGEFLGDRALDSVCDQLRLARVPVLYRGPFSIEAMQSVTGGRETISGQGSHVREGVVIRPCEERTDPAIGRVILKSVSEAYLTRKGGSEYN